MSRFQLKYAESEPDNLDMYMVMADGSEVLIVADVTEAGVEWFADEMALVDNADREQVAAVAAGLRKRMPAKYSYAYAEAQYRRLVDQRPRRCNGQFKRQYGDI